MRDALVNVLTSAERVDIEVAFFYFSGWQLLAEHLRNKKVRILVGKYIDPEAIPALLSEIKTKGQDVDLEPYRPRQSTQSYTAKKSAYLEGFLLLSNESPLFDDGDNQDSLKILEDKVADKSLEIKMTSRTEHGKMYVIHNKPEFSHNGDYPGTVFMGSSNFTFQGLLNQGELNERYGDKNKYEEYVSKFEDLWSDSENIDVATPANKEEILQLFKKELWIHGTPNPYAVYVRVLHELFGKEEIEKIKTPSHISNKRYIDLVYQIDAVRAVLDRLQKYDGVILADVVGLGKSIIAGAAAHNLGLPVVIIAPPHLKDQWDDYQEEFKLTGARVFTSGKIDDVYERYQNNRQPVLFIIDEAHRYRNEDTDDYRMLHHICGSHPGNKVILLTATPFNNDPKDVFALIKLFQVPGQSTIRSVDNLSLRFRELIERYRKLNRDRRSKKVGQSYIDKEADEISLELRRLVENIVIRRSRLDLQTITRYREDLQRQNIAFAHVDGPELIKYELGDLLDLYLDTLNKIYPEPGQSTGGTQGFAGARYKPAMYIKDTKAFLEKYGEDLDESDLKTAQTNLAKLMKRLLVMRFESSKDAFRLTLDNMIASTQMIEDWWHKLGRVPIMKKGNIPDPEEILETTDDNLKTEVDAQTFEEELKKLKETKGLISVDVSLIDPKFVEDIAQDRRLLEDIRERWFGEKANPQKDSDPKLDEVKRKMEELLVDSPARKIIIFSVYADTINYLYRELSRRGVSRVLKYTAADASAQMKKTIRRNFDAGIPEHEQENDYDVLLSTDALSEGYNLHRAGVVINYDIPYNPTRVIQRIGRINRINKKVFEKLFIYNCFPTEVGEDEVRIKQISTLKMRLINSVMGSDVRTLTADEKLQSFFEDEYRKAEEQNETRSWDAVHREAYDQAKRDPALFEEALNIKPRSRVIREQQKKSAIVAFGKKGTHAVFAVKESADLAPAIVATEVALNYFVAEKDERGAEADKQYDEVFKLVRNTLFEKHPLPPIKGRRADALKVVKVIEEGVPKAKDYCRDLALVIKKYDGINEGDLKGITQLSVRDLEAAYATLQEIVPRHHIAAISERVARLEGEYETIVLSEDIRL